MDAAIMAIADNVKVEKSVEKRKPVSLYFRFSRGGYLIDIIINNIYKYEKRVKRRDFQAPSGGGFVVWMESYEHRDASLYSFLIFPNEINRLKANSVRGAKVRALRRERSGA
jgi:hypothetical protein